MSKLEKDKKIVILCTLCGNKISMTREEVKNHKNWDQYIIRHEADSTMTFIQVGTLCDSCLVKPLEQRILRKH